MSARGLDERPPPRGGPLVKVDAIFERFAQDGVAPGLVYGVLAGGETHIGTSGVRDVDSGAPVDSATVFRAAHAYERAMPWRGQRPAMAQ